MDGGAWWATVHGVAKSRTRLSNFTHFTQQASLVAQTVVCLTPMREPRVQSLGREYTLQEEGNQYSCLENSMDRGAWWATVHGSQRVGHD